MIGERIRQARCAAGLKLDDIVIAMDNLGLSISKQAISNYERNTRTPSAVFLLKLAKIVKVKSSFFLQEPDFTVEWTAYRRQSRLGKSERDQVEAFGQGFVEKHLSLQMKLKPAYKPSFPAPYPTKIFSDAEKAAEKLREKWRLGETPIGSMMGTIEDNGGIVVPFPFQSVKFDALSGFVDKRYPVIVINTNITDDRLRFNLGHELGHLCMDCQEVSAKEEEQLAHRFAAAFLIPEPNVKKELGEKRPQLGINELGLLKKKYGASMQVWLRRCRDVGVISDSNYTSMCKFFSLKGWRKKEPVQYTGSEKSEKLKQLIFHALSENIITHIRAEQLYPGCVSEFGPEIEQDKYSYKNMMKLSRQERSAILEKAAKEASDDYLNDPELTAFDVFDGDGID